MTVHPKVVVVGGSGFVGQETMTALARRGAQPVAVRAPRVSAPTPLSSSEVSERYSDEIRRLQSAFDGAHAVVNCAGDPDAGSRDLATLYGANGVLPGVIAAAAGKASVQRLVHVSSAVVQGRRPVLDDSFDVDGFSAYSRSKIVGERMTLDLGPVETVVYRPPSVHAASRKVSRLTARIAGSPLASVAAPGSQPSPQALIENVGDVIAFLATTPLSPPPVVIHPSEGLTSADLMRLLGAREPMRLPRPLARGAVSAAALAGRLVPALAANARRVEMLWFGQGQAPSWAAENGWAPLRGRDGWTALATEIKSSRTDLEGTLHAAR